MARSLLHGASNAARLALCLGTLALDGCAAESAPDRAPAEPAGARPSGATPGAQPRDASQIPVFPGMRVASVDTVVDHDSDMRDTWGNPVPLVAHRMVTYTTLATPEEVFAFYAEHLPGQEAYDQEDVDALRREPGEFTRTIRGRNLHDVGDDHSGENPASGAKKRAVLAGRPPAAPGEWISDATFEWSFRRPDGDIVQMGVLVRDEGVQGNWATYSPRTVVEIGEARYRPRPDA